MGTIPGYIALLVFIITPKPCDGACSVSSTPATPSLTTAEYLTSPGYPSPYSNYEDCSWQITATTSTNNILFMVEYLSVEQYYDFLTVVGDADTLFNSRYNYYTTYKRGISPSDDIDVTFTSDYSMTFGGFSLAYMEVDRTSLPTCGGTITASSSIQQTSYLDFMQGYSTCIWTISVSSSSNIIEYSVPMVVSGECEINDGGSLSGSGSGSGSVVGGVTTRIVTSGAMEYLSSGDEIIVTGQSGDAFVLLYREVSTSATTPSTTTTTDNSGDSICSVSYLIADSTSQYVTSPNYPSPYNSYAACGLVISGYDADDAVHLEILDYAVASPDYLNIYHGEYSYFPMIDETVETGLVVESLGNSFYLWFSTDSYSNLRGFEIMYRNTSRNTASCAQNYTTYDIDHTHYSLTSPNYPSDYTNNLDEYYLLVKPNETSTLVLDFKYMKVELSTDCIYDYIDIYDGPCMDYMLFARLCGYEKEKIVHRNGLYVLIHFHTDRSVVHKGFEIDVFIQDTDAQSSIGESTEEDKDASRNKIKYIVIGVVAAVIILGVILFFVFGVRGGLKGGKKKRHDGVLISSTAGNKVYPNNDTEAKVQNTKIKKLTTSQLLEEMNRRYGLGESDKNANARFKQQVHPAPNPAGADTKIMNKSQFNGGNLPGPNKPPLPPAFTGFQPGIEQRPPTASTLFTGQDAPPIKDFTNTTPGVVPPPFNYITPAEARANGTYRQA